MEEDDSLTESQSKPCKKQRGGIEKYLNRLWGETAGSGDGGSKRVAGWFE